MGQGDEKNPLKPIKPLALRYNDTRRTLKFYKEQLKLKSKRSRLLILAIADKLNEKEVEVVKIQREADLKLSQIWHQLLFLQGNLSKEQLRLNQLLQDKENIIQSQRQEISKLRQAVEIAEKVSSVSLTAKNNNGSFRRAKRERNSVTKNPQHTSSTDESSPSPSSTPKPRQLIRQLSNDNKDPSDKQSKELLSASVSLTRQNKFTKGSERPKLKSTNSTGTPAPCINDESKGPKGILKQSSNPTTPVQPQIKPPVPSRTKINEKLKGTISSDDSTGGRFTNYRGLSSRDSGNSSLDSSDPSSSMEWKLSVRSTIPIHNNNLSIPRQEMRVKPPPPPRRSKSYERPANLETTPDIQKNFEEYDLSFMDNDKTLFKHVKRVSFQDYESTPMRPLRKMPSFPILATETLFSESSETPENLNKVPFQPAIKPVFTKHTDASVPKFSSFKRDSGSPQKLLEPSTLENLQARVESTSVISQLLKDSMITNTEHNLSEASPGCKSSTPSEEGEHANTAKVSTNCKYYF
eukprot:GFUD01036208.1.p1 GENE.GFUD01036208.1~~GFUD01036208.1.p1  ORF type:complete len:522 (-),score=68.95 GFUD01036208.1:124-1689(-)